MSQVVQVAGPRRAPRTKGPRFAGIAPGAGATAPVAFGATKGRQPQPKKKAQKKRNGNGKRIGDCWNAFMPSHLALPRAVGEYSVVRGTKQISTSAPLIIVGTFMHIPGTGASDGGTSWSNKCALLCSDLSRAPTEAYWTKKNMPLLSSGGLGHSAQVVPSAVSVQIMNPGALQTTNGMLYIGKMKTQPQYGSDSTTTAQAIAGDFVSYMAPRLCAAAKLALRGIQVDAHPLNMSRLADFTDVYDGFSGDNASVAWEKEFEPCGFSPIVIYNPDGVELNLLVCHEYRTRFGLSNPAAASHKYHAPSTDATWASAIKTATEMGAGALDIADVVANSGLLQRFGKMMA